MGDPNAVLALGVLGLAGFSLCSLAGLTGWEKWLALRRLEAAGARAPRPSRSVAGRPAMADLKERVRRLEAIANGVDPRRGA